MRVAVSLHRHDALFHTVHSLILVGPQSVASVQTQTDRHTHTHTHTLHLLLAEAALQHPAREQFPNFTSRVFEAPRAHTHIVTFIDGKLTQENLCLSDWLSLRRSRKRDRKRKREFLLTELLIFSVKRVSSAVWWKAQTCVGPISRRCKETPSVLRKVKVTSRLFNMMSSLCRLCMLFFLLFHVFTLRHTKLQTH